MNPTFDRRRVLSLLVACVGGAVVGFTTLGREPRESERLLQLLDGLRPDGRSRDLGRMYLEKHPELKDVERLVRSIGTPTTPDGAWLRDKIAREFRDGATLFLGGWLVSETEARLCALAYLTAAEDAGR